MAQIGSDRRNRDTGRQIQRPGPTVTRPLTLVISKQVEGVEELSDNQRETIKTAVAPAFRSRQTPTLAIIYDHLSSLVGGMLHSLKTMSDRILLVIREGAEHKEVTLRFNHFVTIVGPA